MIRQAVAGVAAEISLNASALVTGSQAAAKGAILIEHQDGTGPGRLEFDGDVDPDANALSLALSAREPAGGLVAGLADISDQPPLDLACPAGPLKERWSAWFAVVSVQEPMRIWHSMLVWWRR